jgi:CRISPR-associated protein Cas5d
MWKPAIRYVVDEIAVCAPIRHENIRRNELSSKIPYKLPQTAARELGKGALYQAAGSDRAQRASRVLRHVRYLVTAHFEMTDKAAESDNEGKFTDMIKRRLRNGQNYHTPYLGTREFPAKVRLVEGEYECPSPVEEDRVFGLVLYDIEYVKAHDKNNVEWIKDFIPLFYWAEMRQGVIDLRNVEVLR